MDPSLFSGTACCFTGHRPDGMPAPGSRAETLLELKLFEAVDAACEAGVTRFLNGGAQGFDLMAAEAVLAVSEKRPGITLELELPSPRHAENWPAGDRERFERIAASAASVRYAADANFPFAYLSRNRALVDRADCCICYLKKTKGGTMYTVNYAFERGLAVINLYDPAEDHM